MKNTIIGFMGAVCLFLFAGATSSNSDNGRYQAFTDENDVYMINTHTGEMWIHEVDYKPDGTDWKIEKYWGKWNNGEFRETSKKEENHIFFVPIDE